MHGFYRYGAPHGGLRRPELRYESWACATQPEVRYFRTSNQIFPGSLVSRPLVKRNEDPGYEGGQRDESRVFVRMLGGANLLPVAVQVRAVVVS